MLWIKEWYVLLAVSGARINQNLELQKNVALIFI
jgi:hypothetical protein